jgi:hypothetical protein
MKDVEGCHGQAHTCCGNKLGFTQDCPSCGELCDCRLCARSLEEALEETEAGLAAEPPSYFEWDRLDAAGKTPATPRPMGPKREGSSYCQSFSIAAGGTNEYCTCNWCW